MNQSNVLTSILPIHMYRLSSIDYFKCISLLYIDYYSCKFFAPCLMPSFFNYFFPFNNSIAVNDNSDGHRIYTCLGVLLAYGVCDTHIHDQGAAEN